MSKTDLLMFLHTSAPISKQCLPSCSGGHLGVIFLLSLPPYTATVSSTSAVSAEVLFFSAICPHPGTISPRKFTYLLTALRPLLWPLQSLCRRDYVGLLRQ